MSGTWDPAEYHDTFRDDILALVDRKVREGRTESVEPMEAEQAAPRTGNVIDLTDLLRQSLAKRGKGKGASNDDAEDEPAPRKRAPRKAAAKTARKTATRKRA
jgi:DNA end-binding protein Ku